MSETNPFWLVSKAPRDLQAQIHLALSRGYQVVTQTKTTAQLIRKKHFSCLIATVLLLFFGLPFLVYLLYFMGKKDDLVYLDVGRQPSEEEILEYVEAENARLRQRNKWIITFLLVFFILIYLIGIISFTNKRF